MSEQMTVKKDLKCGFNMPKKISSEFGGNGEKSHGLPPYALVDAYPVDEYEACPTNWEHGSDVASSYFVGVEEDNGMWLDFNECFYHTHDVAVVISIQGVNPITGQKMVKEKALCLEQYHKNCPIHGAKFQQDRYCPECGFKWPGQNYLATTGTPEMMLWLDGFRSQDGNVRQYVFTEEEMKGIASQMIGKDRVYAIGIAYYLSKNKRPYTLERPEKRENQSYGGHSGSPMFCGMPSAYMGCVDPNRTWDLGGSTARKGLISCDSNDDDLDMSIDSFTGGAIGMNLGMNLGSSISNSASNSASNSRDGNKGVLRSRSAKKYGSKGQIRAQAAVSPADKLRGFVAPVTPVKKLEIGAGALIEQSIYDDPKMMDYWEKEPAGMIYINYCDEETKKKILDGGRRADEKDGFMKNLKVGG